MLTAIARHSIALLLLATLAACGGGGGGGGDGGVNPPPPPVSRTPQLLAYSASDGMSANGTTEMYTIEDDASRRTILSIDQTFNTTTIKDFSVSPNGDWVAYISNVDGTNEDGLYVNSVNGGTPVRVSRRRSGFVGRVDSFQWSPDSMQLVYAGNLGSNVPLTALTAKEVFLVNRDGSGDTQINGALGRPVVVEVRDPQWSPDGRYIMQEVAKFSAQQGSTNAYAINIYDTTVGAANSRRLVTSISVLKNVHWSADSSRLSYTADQESNATYFGYAIGADGSGNARVTVNGDFNSDSKWSPTGATLAYLDHPSQSFPVDLIVSATNPGATDTVLVLVSDNGRRVYDYAWSPDGTRIAYTSDEESGNARELFVINADGSGARTKVSGPQTSTSDAFEFAWSPDGNSIAYLSDAETNTFIDLYVSNSAGTSNTQISSGLNGEEVIDFAWSNDSQRLTFSTGPEGRTPQPNKLYVSQPNGSGRIEISEPMTGGPLRFEYDQ